MLTIILSLFGLGFVATVLFAALSWYGHRGMSHIPREEDYGNPEPDWIVEAICRWQDRNALRIFQVVFFYCALQLLRACVPL